MAAPARRPFFERFVSAAVTTKAATRAGLDAAYRTARGTTVAVAQTAQNATEAVKDGAQAVQDTASLATEIPGAVATRVRAELEEWWARASRQSAIAAVVGVLGVFALVTLTMGATVWLNRQLGDPYGTLLVALAFAVATGVAVSFLRRADPRPQAVRPPSVP